jgi:hypothetical protein
MKKMVYFQSLLAISCLVGCSDTKNLTEIARNEVAQAVLDEQVALANFNSEVLSVNGLVKSQDAVPIQNAEVTWLGDASATEEIILGATAQTGADGSFSFLNLSRKNQLLRISAPGFRTEFIPVYRQLPVNQTEIQIPPIILTSVSESNTQFIFGGDTAFGRRFLDPEELTAFNAIPPDNSNAMILSSNPEPGTREVIKQIRPYFQAADWSVVNFETAVTDQPATPHPEKDFVFFTLPGSLPALDWLGVDYVSLGNNHVYDYLEEGILDTLFHLENAQIPSSGAGINSEAAFAPYRQQVNASPYSFLSMTSVTGGQHSISYVAEAGKGGAADLTQDLEVSNIIQSETLAGQIPIVQYHTGKEYTFEPSSYVVSRIQLAADESVPLAVLHHPHVAQGVGLFDNTFALLGLGNLAFDQARLETMLGVMGRVDMNGAAVQQIRMLPVYLESFAPQLISGALAHDFLRRLGEYSHAYNVLLYPYNGQGWVSMSPDDVQAVDRSINVNLQIDSTGQAIVDLREWLSWGESLLSITTNNNVTLQGGRDLMQHGGFEDWDTDTEFNESARWELASESRFTCLSHAFRGSNSVCSVRKSVNTSDTVISFKNRIRVMGDAFNTPNKDIALLGYFKASNSGAIKIESQYYASSGDLTFGQETAFTSSGGTHDWQTIYTELNMPADTAGDPELDARALRIFISQSPPEEGEGLAAFDEFAIIGWEDMITFNQAVDVPHAKDFIKVSGEAGSVSLTLNFRKHVPSASL